MTMTGDSPTDEISTDLAIPERDLATELAIAERQLALRRGELEMARQEAMILASSPGIVPNDYVLHPQRNPQAVEKILAAGLYGATFKWDLPTSLRFIHVIDGKPSLATEAIVAMIHRAGHKVDLIELTTERCVVYGQRSDTGSEQQAVYTMEDAKLAGLNNKNNWKKHPKAMLWARAISGLSKRLFPDVTLGAYVEDEIEHVDIKRSAPATDLETRPADVEAELGITVGQIIDRYEEIIERLEGQTFEDTVASVNDKLRARYGEAHPEIKTIYSLTDQMLPQNQLELIWNFIDGLGIWDDPKTDDDEEEVIEDIELVDSE